MLIYVPLSYFNLFTALYEKAFINGNTAHEIEYLFCDFDDALLGNWIDKKLVSYVICRLRQMKVKYSFQSEDLIKYNNIVLLKSKYAVDFSKPVTKEISVDLTSWADLATSGHHLVYSCKALSAPMSANLKEQASDLQLMSFNDRDHFASLLSFPAISSVDLSGLVYRRKIMRFFAGSNSASNETLVFLIRLLTKAKDALRAGDYERNTLGLKKILIHEVDKLIYAACF